MPLLALSRPKSHFLMTQDTRQNHSAGTAGLESDNDGFDAKIRETVHWSSQELHLIDIFGMRIQLTYREILAIFSNRLIIGLLFLNAAVFFAIDPHGYRGHLSGSWSLAIWIGSTVFLVAIRLTTYSVVAISQHRGVFQRLYVPAVSVLEYGLVFYVVARVSYGLAADDYAFNFAASFPYLLFGFLMLEAFFLRFVIPDAIAKQRAGGANATIEQAAAASPPESAEYTAAPTKEEPITFLEIGDRKIRFDHLMWLNSEEHYVHIKTVHENLTVRAKLPDILGQLPDDLGVRCHRSWWVSRIARPTLKKCDQGLCLVCEQDCQAPIARSRKKEVQEWLDLNRDW